jgi:hypothetical protein
MAARWTTFNGWQLISLNKGGKWYGTLRQNVRTLGTVQSVAQVTVEHNSKSISGLIREWRHPASLGMAHSEKPQNGLESSSGIYSSRRYRWDAKSGEVAAELE